MEARETPWERRERLAREEREEHRRWMRRRRYGGGQGLGALALGVLLASAGLALRSARADMQHQAWRVELAANVDRLRTAEVSYEMAYGRYLSMGHPAEAYDAVDAGRPYAPDNDMGWRPAGGRGAYWVIARDDGFEVHGLLDADGDGFPAHWKATEARPAWPISDKETF